jgi:hypothetical protein
MTRVRFRHNQRGVIRESDLIICTQAEWETADEHDQPEWSIVLADLEELRPPGHIVCALNLGELHAGKAPSPKTA